MTALRQVKAMLENGWQESRSGRVVDVPEPEFVTENNRDQVDYKTQDACIIKDGGTQNIDPQSFNWVEERVETSVEIDIRTADRRESGSKIDGRTRMFGYINETDSTDQYGLQPDESESHGGLLGETRKVLTSYRKGHNAYDLVETREVNDVTDMVSKNRYRCTINVRLVEIARTLGN